MKRHLLVFDDGNGSDLDLGAFVEKLDEGSEIYTLDDHVCFVKSELTVEEISERFLNYAGSRLFFVTDISASPWSGRMVGSFWEYLRKPALSPAAE